MGGTTTWGLCMPLRAGGSYAASIASYVWILLTFGHRRYFLWDTLDAVVNFIDLGFVVHGKRILGI